MPCTLRMSELDYAMEPKEECSNNDPNDAAFIWATATIRGRDTIEEHFACKMYPLTASFGFKVTTFGMTPMSKVETALPLFAVGAIATEHVDHQRLRRRPKEC
jgi:hypothetical protein